MKKIFTNLSELKERLTPEEFHLVEDILTERDADWQKRIRNIPVLAPLLGSFGIVATFYGFEKLLDQTVLVEHPALLLLVGVSILLFTGLFYRKL
jgi:hypothetical protein